MPAAVRSARSRSWGARRRESGRFSAELLDGHVGDANLRILPVPLRRDAVEGQPVRLRLARSQRRNAEVDRIGIRPTRFQHAQRNFFALRKLAEFVFENNFDYDASYHLVAGVCNRAL